MNKKTNILLDVKFIIFNLVFITICHSNSINYAKPVETISTEDSQYIILPNGIKLYTKCKYGILSNKKINQIKALKGAWQERVDDAFNQVLKFIPSNATMVEIGASWAYYSLLFSHKIENATNFMIESHPDHLWCGVKNFELNKKKGYFYRNYFGFEYEKKIKHACGALHMQMDWFIVQNEIDHIDILFVDANGCEYDVLTSSIEAIKKDKIDFFFIATHSLKKHERCLDFFKEQNLDVITKYLPSEKLKDGLIVARRQIIQGPNCINF